MVVNIRLRNQGPVAPEDEDSMGRDWYGYDPSLSDEDLWANNRGRYSFNLDRLANERYATFVFEGKVVLVAEFRDWERVDHPEQRQKYALIGEPLSAGHPVHDALIGTDVGRARYTIWYTADADGVEQKRSSGGGETVLLTWNPTKWDWGSDYEEAIDRTADGEVVQTRWSTGSRRSGLRHGDRAYLLRQGPEPRGIIASGWVTGQIAPDSHWDGQPGIANYAQVELDVVLAPDEILPLDLLRVEVPSQEWSPQGSGSLVRSECVEAVDRLWADHLASLVRKPGAPPEAGPTGSRGQGRQADPDRRKKIEDAAQDRLMALYRDEGWDVEDTRYGNPYDAVAKRGAETLYLEAKGTETPGVTVTLTRGEVEHARSHPGEWVVGVWSGIEFLDDGSVDPDRGRFRVMTVTPEDEQLEIVQYRWRLP